MKIGNQITNPGELKISYKLKSRTAAGDAGGFQVPSYATFATGKGKWTGVHGSEGWMLGTIGATRLGTFLIRYHASMKETCQVEIENEDYEVISMDDIQKRHEYIELKLKLVKPG